MTDYKYTDDEKVISILEFCVALHANANLTPESVKALLDLINRQKREIEELEEIVFMDRSEAIKILKSEAIKEFAETVKANICEVDHTVVDQLVKEMTEAKK